MLRRRLMDENPIITYQEVEYLESSGSQYINTGIYANNNMDFDINFYFPEGDRITTIFGARSAWDSTLYQLTYYERSYFGYGDSYQEDWLDLEFDRKYHIYTSNMNFYIDGTVKYTLLEQTFTTPTTLTLFALNDEFDGINELATCKIYSFKLYENNNCILDFMPCYRVNDNVAGMYDRISDTFFTNSGSGTFILGPDVNN